MRDGQHLFTCTAIYITNLSETQLILLTSAASGKANGWIFLKQDHKHTKYMSTWRNEVTNMITHERKFAAFLNNELTHLNLVL